MRTGSTSTRNAVIVLGRIARANASAFSDGSFSWLISTIACVRLGWVIPAARGVSWLDTVR